MPRCSGLRHEGGHGPFEPLTSRLCLPETDKEWNADIEQNKGFGGMVYLTPFPTRPAALGEWAEEEAALLEKKRHCTTFRGEDGVAKRREFVNYYTGEERGSTEGRGEDDNGGASKRGSQPLVPGRGRSHHGHGRILILTCAAVPPACCACLRARRV